MGREQIAQAVAQVRYRMAQAAKAAGRSPEEVQLCAVCKTRDNDTVRQSAQLPVDFFGENHMQELVAHSQAEAYLGKPCHFIGHLQTNKVKKVVGQATVIQSVDSLRLLEAIEKEATRQDIVQEIFLELNIGEEATKTGAAAEELWPLMEAAAPMNHVRVTGLMAIPPAFDNGPESRRYFAMLRRLQEQAREKGYTNAPMTQLSMGMSGSFEAAILEGATIVRVGTGIYGPRNYSKE